MKKEYITDSAWGKILNIVTTLKNIYIKEEEALRRFFNGVFYIMRTGAQWRELPEVYGKWSAVFRRFKRWSDKGIWERLFEYCIEDPDLEYVMMDATIVRAHACAAGLEKDSHNKEALGRSKGGYTTKIHILADGLGNPLKFIVTPGQTSEITQANELLADVTNCAVIADKGYDSNDLRTNLLVKQCKSVIPGRKNRIVEIPYDTHLYKERSLVEFLISKLKHFRRISSRYDKSKKSYLSFLSFAGACLWLR